MRDGAAARLAFYGARRWEDEANILDNELIDKFNATEAKRNAMQAKRAARLAEAAQSPLPTVVVALPVASGAPVPPGVARRHSVEGVASSECV